MLPLLAFLPGEVLDALGIHSPLAETAINVLALIGATGTGITVIWKAAGTARARLRARQDDGPRRLQRRSAFASFVESRVRDLDNKEEWSDQRFAELEAEVETLGVHNRTDRIQRLLGRSSRLRRERSLSRALMKSRDQLALLQGDPGSGKSVALRFVARKMAASAMHSKRLDAVIPLYINLKGLHPDGAAVDEQLIERFVLDSLRRGSNRDVHRFLDAEFSRGKIEGSWLFLFDSFDEIPEVLSATEVDATVEAYSDAIYNFVHGMSKCRGIIASRYFRAPPSYGLPTLRIVPLSEKRKRELIRKADLGLAETQLLEGISTTAPELSALAANPLFLGLLAEYVRDGATLPSGWYDVFEAFVSRRIDTDREKVERLFGIDHDELRLRSEEIAFTMTATAGLGLNPTREALRAAYESAGFAAADRLPAAMDALEWIKLARSEQSDSSAADPTFTFSHRRFQEYFATRVVIADPDRVSARTLLTDASWRETAVTLCQSQPEQSAEIVDEAESILLASVRAMEEDVGDFAWQPGALHILSLLQSGFAGRTESLPEQLRAAVSSLLRSAGEGGTITDQKWALEVAGTAPSEDLATLLLAAFRGESDWLREVAYRQAARLPRISEALGVEIRRTLVELTATRRLHRDWPSTKAQVMRLRPPDPFLGTARLLRVAPTIDLVVFLLGWLGATFVLELSAPAALGMLLILLALHALYYVSAAYFARGSRLLGSRFEANEMGSMVGLLTMYARILAAFIPLGKAGDPATTVLAVAWLMTSTWSISATYVCLRRPSASWLGWATVQIRLVSVAFEKAGGVAKQIRDTSWAEAAIGLGFTAGVALLFWGLSTLSLPDPPTWAVYGFFALLFGTAFLIQISLMLRTEGHDVLWLRRWSRQRPAALDPEELLKSLRQLRRSRGAADFLRQVRVHRLLRGEEAEQLVRDLLHLIDPPHAWSESLDLPPLLSPVLVEFYEEDGSSLGHFARFESPVADELGRLLEDLRGEEEVPVA